MFIFVQMDKNRRFYIQNYWIIGHFKTMNSFVELL